MTLRVHVLPWLGGLMGAFNYRHRGRMSTPHRGRVHPCVLPDRDTD